MNSPLVVSGVEVKERIVLPRDEDAIRRERLYWRFDSFFEFVPRFCRGDTYSRMRVRHPSIEEDRSSFY